jgi:deoxyribose-phosphate aldolase
MNYSCEDIAAMIDLSLLKPNLTETDIMKGCETALRYAVASVCCAPSAVPMVRKLLENSPVKVSTVIGFPFGYCSTAVKVYEAKEALEAGAEELDMVLNISRLLSGDYAYVQEDIAAVTKVTHEAGGLLKVILENCYLNDAQKSEACRISETAGADFVKTSTGYGSGGATFSDLRLMRAHVSSRVQVKAAGGIRELDTALLVREVGGTRFGCTKTEEIMQECKRRIAMRDQV